MTRALNLFLCIGLTVHILSTAAAGQANTQFFYSHDPNTPVLRISGGGGLGGSQSLIQATLFGDGTIEVYRAPGFKNPGTWRGALPEGRLDALLRQMAQFGVLDFDKASVSARVDESKRMRCPGRMESDGGYQKIEVFLDELIVDGESTAPFAKEVVWSGDSFDAECSPGVPEIIGLYNAFEHLSRLTKVDGLTLVAEP